MSHQTTAPHVTIAIISWNNSADTLECIASVKKMEYPNSEIVVIDNHSTDGSVELIRQRCPDVTLIENETNLGYAGGFNRGLPYAFSKGSKYIFALNNDIVVQRDCLTKLVLYGEEHERVAAVGPIMLSYSDPNEAILSGTRMNWLAGKPYYSRVPVSDADRRTRNVEYLCGAAILIRASAIRRIGMFSEDYFLFYEDADLCLRLKRGGFELRVVPEARVFHKEGVTTGGTHSPDALYYGTRGRLLFMRRHAPTLAWLFFFLLYFPLSFLRNMYRWRAKKPERKAFTQGVIDFLRMRLGKREAS